MASNPIDSIQDEAGWTEATLAALIREWVEQRGETEALAEWLRDRHAIECQLPMTI